jgi:MoaA/NifB/PqqE/SkfB family radical SAM enzyme
MADIGWLHIEVTTRCNAWCPFCPRNVDGFKLTPGLNLEDLPVESLEKRIKQFPNLKAIQFCGISGDPCAAKNIDALLDCAFSFDKIKSIQIHTNGSLRKAEWYAGLVERGKHLERLQIWFAIDGTKETNHIYRQGTSWDKIMDNASAFIKAGGDALWQFIPFEHNKDEILEALKLSQDMGFAKFQLLESDRLITRGGKHYRTGEPLNIKSWYRDGKQPSEDTQHWGNTYDERGEKYVNTGTKNTFVRESNCIHLRDRSVYLDAKNNLYPCCFLWRANCSYENTHVNIKEEFQKKDYRQTCLSVCGSTK